MTVPNAITSAAIATIQERARKAVALFQLRERHPEVPVLLLWNYLGGEGDGESLDEYLCRITTGHRWGYSGTAYGGDDDRWMGEGRCYCMHCGKDGDA